MQNVMPSVMQLFVGLVLFLTIPAPVAADTVSYASDSIAMSDDLVLKTWCLEIVFALVSSLRQTLNFIQSHNFLLWLFFVGLILAVSQGLRTVVVNVSRTLLEVLRLVLDRWLDQSHTIRALQEEINAQYSPSHVQHLYDAISSLKRQHEESESRFLRSNTEVQTLLSACSLKSQQIKRLEEEVRALNNDQSMSAYHTRAYIAQSEIIECRKEKAALKKEVDELDGKLLRAQKRLSGEQWTTHERYELQRQHKIELRKKQEELDQQAEVIAKLKSTPATRTPESKLDPMHIMKSTLQQLTDDADKRLHVVAILFIASLQQFGADLAALNIDAAQFQACLAWARVVFSNWTLITDTGGTEPVSLLAQNGLLGQMIGTVGRPEETTRKAGVIVSKQLGCGSIDIPSAVAGNPGVPLPTSSHKLNRRSAPSGNGTDLERITRYGAVTKLRLPRHSLLSSTGLTRLSVDLSAL
jgi:hypothetical protein